MVDREELVEPEFVLFVLEDELEELLEELVEDVVWEEFEELAEDDTPCSCCHFERIEAKSTV